MGKARALPTEKDGRTVAVGRGTPDHPTVERLLGNALRRTFRLGADGGGKKEEEE